MKLIGSVISFLNSCFYDTLEENYKVRILQDIKLVLQVTEGRALVEKMALGVRDLGDGVVGVGGSVTEARGARKGHVSFLVHVRVVLANCGY